MCWNNLRKYGSSWTSRPKKESITSTHSKKSKRKKGDARNFPRKLTCPKRNYFNRKYIFQPLVFRGHVSFSGSMSHYTSECLLKSKIHGEFLIEINRKFSKFILTHKLHFPANLLRPIMFGMLNSRRCKNPWKSSRQPSATQKKCVAGLVDFLDFFGSPLKLYQKQDANHGDWNMFSPDLPEIDP